jgi:hypothetical protein
VQQIAAVAVPNSSLFHTVADENGRPMVFSVGTDKKFYVLKEDIEGHCLISDLESMLRLPAAYAAQVLSVTQDRASNIFVALAIEDQGSSAERKPSIIYILQPFKPQDQNLSDATANLSSLIIPQKGANTGLQVSSIFTVSYLMRSKLCLN